jgi:polyisoprenyl-phosphate glycosyltransferase
VPKRSTVSFVLPVWNEEENIELIIKSIYSCVPSTYQPEIVIVADPCDDDTIKIAKRLTASYKRLVVVETSRKFGQPMCTLCGLNFVTGDCTIIMDADFQDPPDLLPQMLALWEDGYDVVLPQRSRRYGETKTKRLITKLGYRVINQFSRLEMPENVSDFRLIDSKVVDVIKSMEESHGYLRGMVAYAGFNQIYLPFERPARNAGTSKYNKRLGSILIASNGLFAYSAATLQIMFLTALATSAFSFIAALIITTLKLFGVLFPLGYTSLIVVQFMIGSILLLALTVLGGYLERIYEETRKRPRYIVASVTETSKDLN